MQFIFLHGGALSIARFYWGGLVVNPIVSSTGVCLLSTAKICTLQNPTRCQQVPLISFVYVVIAAIQLICHQRADNQVRSALGVVQCYNQRQCAPIQANCSQLHPGLTCGVVVTVGESQMN